MKIFAIVLNWNRFNDTVECLESLDNLEFDKNSLEVLVVDNASSDDSFKKLKEVKMKKFNLTVLQNKENLGFAEGNNVGIRHAIQNDADYLLVINNDTTVDKNLLTNLLNSYSTDTNIGAISPKIYFAKGYEFHKERYSKEELGKVIWYAGGLMDWNNIYGTNRGVDEVDKGQFDKVVETDFFTGSCVLLKVGSLKKVGFFDKKYFMYLEDADLSQRMKIKGLKVLYTPSAKIWHKVSQSSAIGSNLNDYFIGRNRLLFGMRYANFRTRFALYRESLRLLINGRTWQKKAVIDFYFNNLGKGSWK